MTMSVCMGKSKLFKYMCVKQSLRVKTILFATLFPQEDNLVTHTDNGELSRVVN